MKELVATLTAFDEFCTWMLCAFLSARELHY